MSRCRRAAASVVAAASLLLTGCSTIPSSSEVHAAGGVDVEDLSSPITNVVIGPTPGESPDQIVTGFFTGMLAYPQSTDTVKEFMTAAAASRWDAEDSLTVYDDLETAASGNLVNVRMSLTGSLDQRQSWSSVPVDEQTSQLTVRVKREAGEWRIVNPPPGTFVTTDYFNRYYEPLSLYYFDPSRTILTPDPVYLQIGDSTATQLVQDLLLGPTRLLQGAVTSAAPPDTQVEVAVTVSDTGVADVPLSADVLKMSDGDRNLFAAQLAWTLRQIPGIAQIAVTVDGTDLVIPATASPFDADAFSGYDPAGLSGERRLFALSPQGLTALVPSQAPVQGPIGQVTGGSSMAVQTSGQLGAVVSGDGTTISVGSMQPDPEGGVGSWFVGSDLLRPSWDAVGVLWVVDQTPKDGAAIYTVTGAGARPVARAPLLAGSDISAFAVSRDGVRFAAVVERDGGTELDIATIVRGGSTPTKVTLRRPVVVVDATAPLTDVRDVAWVGPTSLAVLAREVGGDLQPFVVAIDGSDTQTAGGFLSVHPTSIAAGPDATARIAVGTAAGEVYVQSPDTQWEVVGTARWLRAPAYPG